MYEIDDTSGIISPGIVLFRDVLEANVDEMIRIAGSADRLRPHCKTHKMAEVAKIQLAKGIAKHKAATFAEAEMLAEAGARDVFLAYNMVGPNVARAVGFRMKYPDVTFMVTADHPAPVAALGKAMHEAGTTIEVLLDVDSGMHRTGVATSDAGRDLYRAMAETAGLEAGGLHVYDGQNRQEPLEDRIAAVDEVWRATASFRDSLVADGLPVPRIVAGGTPTFPAWTRIDDPTLELSPGTCVLHDCGYGSHFTDMKFTPAALLLTRVISRPTPDTLTLDLGTKGVASDPPADRRVEFPALPDAELLRQNEEHLVVRTSRANEYQPGDELLAIPRHVCPTSALHHHVWIVVGGKVVGTWEVTARDRQLTI